jgi:hypothetical protein
MSLIPEYRTTDVTIPVKGEGGERKRATSLIEEHDNHRPKEKRRWISFSILYRYCDDSLKSMFECKDVNQEWRHFSFRRTSHAYVNWSGGSRNRSTLPAIRSDVISDLQGLFLQMQFPKCYTKIT